VLRGLQPRSVGRAAHHLDRGYDRLEAAQLAGSDIRRVNDEPANCPRVWHSPAKARSRTCRCSHRPMDQSRLLDGPTWQTPPVVGKPQRRNER
jgi:hypothetical protein